jgi:hypothetical protein
LTHFFRGVDELAWIEARQSIILTTLSISRDSQTSLFASRSCQP